MQKASNKNSKKAKKSIVTPFLILEIRAKLDLLMP